MHNLGREELYERVWSEPMATLAPKLGISDVALKKRCKKLGIPTPPRGYWAKLEAGKHVKRPPLPTSWEVPKRKKSEPQSAEDVWKFDVPVRDYTVAKYPPVVAATKRALKSAGRGYYGVVDIGGDGALRTKVATHSFDRALWLWTELLAKLAEARITILADASSLTDGVETVIIELKEMTAKFTLKESTSASSSTRRTPHPLDYRSTQEWAPTGVLVFRAEASSYSSARKWQETELRRMEDRLDDVAAGIQQLLKNKHVAHLESIERQKRWEEERRAREEEEARQRHEMARRRKLVRLAGSADRAGQVRHLASELLSRASVSRQDEVTKFVEWALAYADRLDPVARILKAIDEGIDPVEPEHEDKYLSEPRRYG